jgi:phosphoribosylaminoimidazole-succinocarboxamide synthase
MPAPGAIADGARPVVRTNLPLPGRREGKVRDVYQIPAAPGQPPRLLIVATDRISAFDVVLPTPIPGKGRLLTEISVRWFHAMRDRRLAGDHLLSDDPRDLPGLSPEDKALLEGRVMVCRAAEVVPVEFVVRGYLAGSGWKEYGRTQSVCGVRLPPGLRNGEKLPEPILTPTTKAASGHDEPMRFEEVEAALGKPAAAKLRKTALEIYSAGAEYALRRGIILADTKFEFGRALDMRGRPTDEIILVDELLTPDSSRYWPADQYRPGGEQPNFDKQFVRDYLQGLVDAGRWDKTPPGPELPPRVVADTLARYREARERLFGQKH